jgi:hypothetical protein
MGLRAALVPEFPLIPEAGCVNDTDINPPVTAIQTLASLADDLATTALAAANAAQITSASAQTSAAAALTVATAAQAAVGAIPVASTAMTPVITATTLAAALSLLAAGGLININASGALVTATGSVTARTLADRSGDVFSVKNFGAIGNDVADDTTALAATNTAAAVLSTSLYVPAGAYKITANLTLTQPVIFAAGAVFNVATGCTVAFNGGLVAIPKKIFALTGSALITINGSLTPWSFPEWWGAQVNTPGFDCQPAINAAIVATPNVALAAADYYVANTVQQQTAHRNVVGVGGNAQGTNSASRILSTSATQAVWNIGPTTAPTTMAGYQSNNRLTDVCLDRTVAPDVSSGSPSSGLYVQYTVWTTVRGVWAYQHCIAFNLVNNSGGSYLDNVASRTVAGVGGTDRFFGWLLTGNTAITPGLFSLYLTHNIVGCSLGLAASYGLYASGTNGINDLFVTQHETSACAYGAFVQGNGNTSTTADFFNEDIRFVDCTFDTCFIAGYAFGSISTYGVITVMGGYVAPLTHAGITPQGALLFSNSMGSITVIGTQLLMYFCPAMPAILATSSQCIKTSCVITEPGTAPLVLVGVTRSSFDDEIRNNSVQPNTGCVQVSTGCTRNKFNVRIMGRSGAWASGYNISTGQGTYSEYNCTGIDAACITAGSGNKLLNGGAQVTSFGFFGTSLASGVMG